MKLATYHGAVTKLPGAGPISDSFANEDLYWLGRSTAVHSWATRPRATDMTSAVVSRGLTAKTATEYSHTAMTVAGAYAADRPEGAVLPSGGSTATAQVDIPRDGAYVLGVVAGGSIAAGEWPAGSVLVDGQTVGEFACQKGEFDTYALPADLKAGKREVTIRFTNDMYDEANKQDRNLLVKALLVAPDDRAREVTFLTSPPALAVVKAGPGRVVLDCITWDRTQSNTEKATRYIAGLLTGLGAPFEPVGAGTVLDLNSFTPQPDLPWFRHEGGGLYMGAAGYVRGDIECARSGQYVMRVTARGTPAAGQFPIVAVEMDGQEVGKIELKSDGWRSYRLPIKLAEGKHELKLTFTNDIYEPPEDTNLWIGRVEVGESE